MSKLRANDNKEKKNYFSNTEQVYELIKMLLQEFYSKEISDVGLDLLYNGASTLFEIQSRLKLSFENVRNYLIIMLQNNLIQKKIMARNEIKYNLYELKDEQILNILLFPRTLNFMEKKYGNYGRMIFEQFIGFGILTLKQIIEQIQNDQKNEKGTTFELIKTKVVDSFIKLYEDNFIAYSERANEDENYNSPSNKINDLSGNKKEKKRILKKMTKKLLIKKKKREKVIKRKKMRKKIQSNKKI
jgi:transcription initiation factor IIE alpha subunit